MPSTQTDRIGGLSTSVAIKARALFTTTGNITLSGLGVQAGGDWAAMLEDKTRILVQDQTDPVDNGVWLASAGAWTRARDFDGNRDVTQGTLVFVYGGETLGRRAYHVTTEDPVVVGTSAITFELWPEIANTAELIGYRGRSLYDRLADGLSAKDYFGAAGDGVTIDTDAIEDIMFEVFNSGRGATIDFPPGVYQIDRSLVMEPNVSDRPWRNVLFRGQGGGYGANPAVMLRYVATSSTDPANYQNGLFDIISGQNIDFECINFMNDAVGINHIIRIRAEAPSGVPTSTWKGGFRNCFFQNPANATKELAVAQLYMYNTLDMTIEKCWWMGSPTNVIQGSDPADTTGIAAGFTGRVLYTNCYFTGDVILRRTEVTNFIGNTFAEKWRNPVPFTESAQLILSNHIWARNISVNVIGNQFEGLFNPSTYTAGAIVGNGNTDGLNVQGNSFGSGYTRALFVGLDTSSVVFKGNYLDLDNASSRGVVIASNMTGSIDISDNTMSAAMVSASGAMLTDARPYRWPYTAKVNAASNYSVAAANTWESALTSSAVSYPAGRYRIKAVAVVVGGAANTNLSIRVTNSDGGGSAYESEATVGAGEVATVTIDEIVELPAGTSVAWYLQVREQTTDTGSVRALGIGGTPVTYLHVIWEG